MPQKVRIALDAMGGDVGASVVIPGAAISLTRHPDSEFLLFGNRALIEAGLEAKFLYGVDDMDAMDSQALLTADAIERYMGAPLSRVPAPEGSTAANYARHFVGEIFFRTFEPLGIRPEYVEVAGADAAGAVAATVLQAQDIGTYWLVRSTPMFATSAVDQQQRHEPDYFTAGHPHAEPLRGGFGPRFINVCHSDKPSLRRALEAVEVGLRYGPRADDRYAHRLGRIDGIAPGSAHCIRTQGIDRGTPSQAAQPAAPCGR